MECEVRARKKLVPHGALWSRSPFCALLKCGHCDGLHRSPLVCVRVERASPLPLQCTYSRVNNPSYSRSVIHVKENAVTNGSICPMLPASAFVSWAFDVIDTWCFQRHGSSAPQRLAQNKVEERGFALRSVWISTSEGERKSSGVCGSAGTLMIDHKHGNVVNPWPLSPPAIARVQIVLPTARTRLGLVSTATFLWNFSKSFLCPLPYIWPAAGMCWAQPQWEKRDRKGLAKDLLCSGLFCKVSFSCSYIVGR